MNNSAGGLYQTNAWDNYKYEIMEYSQKSTKI